MQFGWLLVTAEFHDVYVADAAAGTDAGQRGGFYDDRREIERERAVSYTHLTLPTILRV